MEIKDFQVSMEFPNDVRVEWLCSNDGSKEAHFDPWLFDGQRRIPMLMSHFKSLPDEPGGYKEGEFMKGNSDQTSWKLRYFIVRGGLMTYFKDKDSSKPQGTIPLKDCSIDLPNDGRKSFLIRGRGRDIDGFEMRITHSSRRPFLLVFLTGEKRTDWYNFLSQYIAISFLSPEYLLGEKIRAVDDGLYVVKKVTPINGNQPDVMTSDQKKCYLYIDWNSSSPGSWCLRYSAMKLMLRPYDEETESSVIENQPASSTISLHSIRSVELAEFPSSSILVNVQGKSIFEFAPIVSNRTVGNEWVCAIQAALKLQDLSAGSLPQRGIQRSTSPGRNSSRHINDLKSLLQSDVEPSVAYTRAQFLRDEKLYFLKTKRNTEQDVQPIPNSPLRSRSSLAPNSTNSESLNKSTPLLSKESSISELLNISEIKLESPQNKISQEVGSPSRPQEIKSNSVPIARRVITQRGSSLGLGSIDGMNTSAAGSTSALSTPPPLENKSSFATITSLLSGSETKKKSFSSSMIPTRRLSSHDFSQPTSSNQFHDKASDEGDGSSHEDIQFERPQNSLQNIYLNPSQFITHTESQIDHGTESDSQDEKEITPEAVETPDVHMPMPTLVSHSEHESHNSEHSTNYNISQQLKADDLKVDNTLLSSTAPMSPFHRSHLDSDSSVPPTRRRHRRHRGKSSASGYSTISQSPGSSPGSKYDSDYTTDHKNYSSTAETTTPVLAENESVIRRILAFYDTGFYLISLTPSSISFAKLQCPVSAIPLPIDVHRDIPTSSPFTIRIHDIVAADIDINGSGLLRLTALQDNARKSSSSSLESLRYKSSFNQQSSQFIIKCIGGNTEAVEWIKELHRIKLDHMNKSSSYYSLRRTSS